MDSALNKDNASLRDHYDDVYLKGAQNYYTFSSYEESKTIMAVLGPIEHKRILEIGCGEGALAAMMCMAGAIVKAIDYSQEAIRIAQTRYKLDGLSFRCMQFKKVKGEYDIVVMQGVLEHFDNPFEDLNWIMKNLLNDNGFVITSSPSFLNPRGYVWMTLQLLFDIPMSLSDRYFLCPFDFEEFADNNGYFMEYVSSNQNWGNGEGMITDYKKRLYNALSDAGYITDNVPKLINWLDKAKNYSISDKHTGANVIYKIMKLK